MPFAASKRNKRRPLKTFISGPENKVAWSAICHLIENPAYLPPPVVLHGPPGSGKSHLLAGISRELRKRHPTILQQHFTADRLTRANQAANYRRQVTEFRNELESLDLLLVDGLDRLSNRKSTQRMLSHAVESIREHGGQVILTARSTPRSIEGLSPDLASRLHQGVLIRVDPASSETRLIFIQREFRAREIRLPSPLQDTIVDNIQDPGQLEAICEILQHLMQRGRTINRALIDEVLSRHAPGTAPGRISLTTICALLERQRALEPDTLTQRGGPRERAAARRLALLLAHEQGVQRNELATHFNLKPGSVSAALRKVRTEIDNDLQLATEIEQLRSTLGRTPPACLP